MPSSRTSFLDAALPDYEIHHVSIDPGDWGLTSLARPRIYSMCFRKDRVVVRQNPGEMLRRLCEQVSPGVAGYTLDTCMDATSAETLEMELQLRLKKRAGARTEQGWIQCLTPAQQRSLS